MGSVLLGLGVVVGAAASIVLLLGFEPARLPPAVLNLAAYKLAFIGALGFMGAGAFALRYAKRETTNQAAEPGAAKVRELGEGLPGGLDAPIGRESVRVDRGEQTR
jgi:hypothetical protein